MVVFWQFVKLQSESLLSLTTQIYIPSLSKAGKSYSITWLYKKKKNVYNGPLNVSLDFIIHGLMIVSLFLT